MTTYSIKEITEFLKAANRDLGVNKYRGDEMIPDYCKAVNIGEQLQAENKRLWKAIEIARDFISEKGDYVKQSTREELENVLKG